MSPCSISSTSFRQRYNGMCACIIGFDIVWPLRCVCILRPNRAQLSQFVEPSQAKCCKRTGARNIDTVSVRCRVIKPRTASPSQAMPKRFAKRSKVPSRAKPSQAYIISTRRRVDCWKTRVRSCSTSSTPPCNLSGCRRYGVIPLSVIVWR